MNNDYIYNPFAWYLFGLASLYVGAQYFYGVGTAPEVTRDQLGRIGR